MLRILFFVTLLLYFYINSIFADYFNRLPIFWAKVKKSSYLFFIKKREKRTKREKRKY